MGFAHTWLINSGNRQNILFSTPALTLSITINSFLISLYNFSESPCNSYSFGATIMRGSSET